MENHYLLVHEKIFERYKWEIDFGRSCYFLKSSLIITLIGCVLRFYVFLHFFTLEDLGEILPRPPS